MSAPFPSRLAAIRAKLEFVPADQLDQAAAGALALLDKAATLRAYIGTRADPLYMSLRGAFPEVSDEEREEILSAYQCPEAVFCHPWLFPVHLPGLLEPTEDEFAAAGAHHRQDLGPTICGYCGAEVRGDMAMHDAYCSFKQQALLKGNELKTVSRR